jgi:hypothetical protein
MEVSAVALAKGINLPMYIVAQNQLHKLEKSPYYQYHIHAQRCFSF